MLVADSSVGGGFVRLRVSATRLEANARFLRLRPVLASDCERMLRFVPGQHLIVRAEGSDGETLRRSYSICSPPGADWLEIGARRVSGGAFSQGVCDSLETGSIVEALAPRGKFSAMEGAGLRHAFFAAGSGITPIYSIMSGVLSSDSSSSARLFYGNRDRESIMLLEALSDLKDSFPSRLAIEHALSGESRDSSALEGRLDGAGIRRLAEIGLFDVSSFDAFYLCGPGDMIDEGISALESLGAATERIIFERFAPRRKAKETPKVAEVDVVDVGETEGEIEGEIEIEAIVDGSTRRFRARSGETALAAATRCGISLPHSCEAGMCCTCRCRLLEGEGELLANYSLESWELEAGFTLACQLRPRSRRLALDFDAA